ncbi:MAG TPA: flagellar FliJ family protein [Rhizobacter sp.]|jgi:flagellar biosynthesis chaperone FliJ|nr:flagellar FliJ family protein [Rhizobacter sp.]
MSSASVARLVEVLDIKLERMTIDAAQAAAACAQTRRQIERLGALSVRSEVQAHASMALRANAAGFRSQLMDVADQCRDELGAQESQREAAQQALLAAARHQQVMATVLTRMRARELTRTLKADQKVQDELAARMSAAKSANASNRR